MWRMAFDIGGTFTDFVLAGSDTRPRFLKVASSPDDPARAVVAGFERLLGEAGVAAAGLSAILRLLDRAVRRRGPSRRTGELHAGPSRLDALRHPHRSGVLSARDAEARRRGPAVGLVAQSAALRRFSEPDHPRIRRSDVTRRWPARAVETIRRSAGSGWKSDSAAARMPMSPSTGISTTPCSRCARRQEWTSSDNLIRPLSTSTATSQNDIADTASSSDCHARSISRRAIRPSLASPRLSHSRALVSRRSRGLPPGLSPSPPPTRRPRARRCPR